MLSRFVTRLALFCLLALNLYAQAGEEPKLSRVDGKPWLCVTEDDRPAWDSAATEFVCRAAGAGGGGDSISVNGTAAADANFLTAAKISFSLNQVPTPDEISAAIVAGSLADGDLASAYSGIGSCTNQFARTLTRNAAPTCATVATADVAAALRQDIDTIPIFSPTTADTNKVQHKFASAITLQRVSCSTDTGTVTIQFDERGEGTPNTAGVNVLSASLVCDTNTEATTAFSNAGIAADAPLNLQVTATSGTPGVVRIHVDYQVD